MEKERTFANDHFAPVYMNMKRSNGSEHPNRMNFAVVCPFQVNSKRHINVLKSKRTIALCLFRVVF